MKARSVSEFVKIAVCGAGAMGSGIAQVAAQAGLDVVIYDMFAPALERSRSQIVGGLDQLVTRGKLERSAADGVVSRISWADDLPALATSDLVIEAIIEDFDAKASLFAQLEDIMREDAVLASNTSSLPIARLARGLKYPQRFVGMHFFNPATVMKLVEVVAGPATSPDVASAIEALARSWGKVAVPVADVPGFIVNRVARPFYAEAFRCLQQGGASAEVIDTLFRSSAGFRMGPLELTDLIGQDVNFAVARSVYDAYFGQTRFTPQLVQAALVDANWLGRKTGHGVYPYADGKAPLLPAPEPVDPLPEGPARPDRVGPDLAPFGIEGVNVRMSRGRTAREEQAECGMPTAVIDWFDPASATAAAFAASEDAAADVAARLLASWNLVPLRIADRPGLIVLRTLAQIANAAGDAVLERVSDGQGVDNALRFGANYPFGPVAWGVAIGPRAIIDVLTAIARGTGQPMYNPSEYWIAEQ